MLRPATLGKAVVGELGDDGSLPFSVITLQSISVSMDARRETRKLRSLLRYM